MAARAAHDIGRDDVVVATVDDSPNTYTQIAKLSYNLGAVAFASMSKEINAQIFALLDKIFKGQQVPSNQRFTNFLRDWSAKENLPPKGYFVNPCGIQGCSGFCGEIGKRRSRPPTLPGKGERRGVILILVVFY